MSAAAANNLPPASQDAPIKDLVLRQAGATGWELEVPGEQRSGECRVVGGHLRLRLDGKTHELESAGMARRFRTPGERDLHAFWILGARERYDIRHAGAIHGIERRGQDRFVLLDKRRPVAEVERSGRRFRLAAKEPIPARLALCLLGIAVRAQLPHV